MHVFLSECAKQNVNFIKLKYLIPKSVFISNSLFGEYGESMFDWIGYADDLLLAIADQEILGKGLKILDSTFQRFRLSLNAGKTKTMIYNYQGSDEYPTTIASVNKKWWIT